jgi:hypothetical protein
MLIVIRDESVELEIDAAGRGSNPRYRNKEERKRHHIMYFLPCTTTCSYSCTIYRIRLVRVRQAPIN